MAMAPYQATNIVFAKGDRFQFGSKKQHAVNNMIFFEAAVAAEMRAYKLTKEITDKPHQWDYDSMVQKAKEAEERSKMGRGMTARPDPVVRNKLNDIQHLLQQEQRRREALAPHFKEFFSLFDGVHAGSMHDDFEPIPLSTEAKARRAKVEERKKKREEHQLSPDSMSTRRHSVEANGGQASTMVRTPGLAAIKTQIMRAKGIPVPVKGVMAQTAPRGLLE
jgi:hypothetical protein